MTDRYVISSDRARIDAEFVIQSLRGTYWAADRPREVILESIANSLCFGVFAPDQRQVGFARVVTDGTTFSWLADVFVAEAHRRRGLGRRLVQEVLAHPGVARTRVYLATRDAHAVYEPFGFVRFEVMRRASP